MNKKGFTLIELLIVVAIIGIIAAIAIPNLLIALQKGKQKATMGDMRTIGTGVSTYIVDNSFSPPSSDVTVSSALEASWFTPFFIKLIPPFDSWGTDFRYIGADDNYSITSYGRNKSDDNSSGLYEVTSLTDFNQDIVFSEIFTVGPVVKR